MNYPEQSRPYSKRKSEKGVSYTARVLRRLILAGKYSRLLKVSGSYIISDWVTICNTGMLYALWVLHKQSCVWFCHLHYKYWSITIHFLCCFNAPIYSQHRRPALPRVTFFQVSTTLAAYAKMWIYLCLWSWLIFAPGLNNDSIKRSKKAGTRICQGKLKS